MALSPEAAAYASRSQARSVREVHPHVELTAKGLAAIGPSRDLFVWHRLPPRRRAWFLTDKGRRALAMAWLFG